MSHINVRAEVHLSILNTPIIVTMFSATWSTWFIVLIFSLTSSVTGNIVRANRSPITFPLARRVNLTSIHNLVLQDQTRAKVLKAQGAAKASGLIFHNDAVINSQVDNQAVSYVASVGIGSPATTCKWQCNSLLNVFLFMVF